MFKSFNFFYQGQQLFQLSPDTVNPHIAGLVQERCNSNANALELCLSCINPSIWYVNLWYSETLEHSSVSDGLAGLTLPLDKMATISQTAFSYAFSWMKSFVFWFEFHWSLFLRVQLTIFQLWFR